MESKTEIRYLGRKIDSVFYELGYKREDWHVKKGFMNKSYICFYEANAFRELMNFQLRPGKCVKVKRKRIGNIIKFIIIK